ncbi:DUF1206 domain-containing protein [Microbacterium terregens]|uniref:DUF1206 domain-containing protein n=1 Tax=Microbacterium terregens TaxID=69363 RepID=A0ABV5T035_9MICO
MDSAAPKRVAREAKQSTPFRWTARAGYAANGVVHILIGIIAIVVALGGDGDTDQSGALMLIAGAPLGFVVLWLIAITLWALGIWQIFEGILVRSPSDDARGLAAKWGQRVGAWGQAAIFVALGLISASVALGARVDAEEAAENASRGVLQLPGGSIVLGLVGVGIGIGGIAFVVMGVRRTFRNKIDIPRHGIGRSLAGLGVVGFVAKGVALIIVGILLLVAALKTDPDTAGGLDGAITALLALSYGPWLVAAVGAGFIAYGVFCFFRARFARF